MDYAIMKTGGKQYRVREGDTLDVEKITGDTGDKVIFDQIYYFFRNLLCYPRSPII